MATRGEKLLGLVILLVVVTLPLWARWYAETFGYRQEVAGYRVEFKNLWGANEFRDGKVYVKCSVFRGDCDSEFRVFFKDGLPSHLTLRIQLSVGRLIPERPFFNFSEPQVQIELNAVRQRGKAPNCDFWAKSGTYIIELWFNETGISRCVVNGEELELTGWHVIRDEPSAEWLTVSIGGEYYFEAVVSFEP